MGIRVQQVLQHNNVLTTKIPRLLLQEVEGRYEGLNITKHRQIQTLEDVCVDEETKTSLSY